MRFQCGSYQGLAILQCKNLNFPYFYGVLQCKKREGVEEEVDEEEHLQVAVTGKHDVDMMLSGPPRLQKRKVDEEK